MRRNFREEERQEFLTRFRASSQGQRDFCDSAGISVASLQKWLRAEKPENKFLEVSASRIRVEPRIEIEFLDGTILRVSGVSR